MNIDPKLPKKGGVEQSARDGAIINYKKSHSLPVSGGLRAWTKNIDSYFFAASL
jgi:hypothetical protein